jgi:hypothetical protein
MARSRKVLSNRHRRIHATRAAFRWPQLTALASEYSGPAPGIAEAREWLQTLIASAPQNVDKNGAGLKKGCRKPVPTNAH